MYDLYIRAAPKGCFLVLHQNILLTATMFGDIITLQKQGDISLTATMFDVFLCFGRKEIIMAL